MRIAPLSKKIITEEVRKSLKEDLLSIGDITTKSTVDKNKKIVASIVASHNGILAGIDFAKHTFKILDPKIKFYSVKKDGSKLKSGQIVLKITGKAHAILTGERVALNYLGLLSGCATLTREMVDKVKKYKVDIMCTRKTLPKLRKFQKYAVRVGGGKNHRSNLSDAILIKDNHIIAAGGIKRAIRKTTKIYGRRKKIQLEVDSIKQLKQVLNESIDSVLLDNMNIKSLKKSTKLINGRFLSEASGNINRSNIQQVAKTGVNRISLGAITHSSPTFDFSLEVENNH